MPRFVTLVMLTLLCLVVGTSRSSRAWRPSTAEAAAPGVITTIAGGSVGDGGAAAGGILYYPDGVAVYGSDIYVVDQIECRVRKISGGNITTFAGNGVCVQGGDGGAAQNASMTYPDGIAVDSTGNVFIADWGDCRVRMVSGGTMTTVAGIGGDGGTCGFSGDGGPATSAAIRSASAVAVDAGGNIYIADYQNCRIRKVSAGIITTFAGNGTCSYGGDGGLATAASMRNPSGVAVDVSGNVYIADFYDCRVRKVSSGIITTFAGTGSCSFSGDAGPATSATLYWPDGITVSVGGDVYIADRGNCRVRRVSAGTIDTVAGNGFCGYDGDGSATSVELAHPGDVTVDGSGSVYVVTPDECRVRKLSAGMLSTLLGNGSCGYSGDGGPAVNASLYEPMGMAADGSGNLYVADNANCRIRKLTSGIISTVVGDGFCRYSGDGGPATSASLNSPYGVAVDGAGDLYIADMFNCRIREVIAGTITTIAGSGVCGYSGDGGAATSASLGHVYGLAVAGGNIYVADAENCRVRIVTGGIISTFAGNGTCTSGGDGGAATSASLNDPEAIAVDGAGAVYIAEHSGCRVRKVSGGTITTFAGGSCGSWGDGGPATSAALYMPFGLAVDAEGRVYIADDANCRIRVVSNGTISTIAGIGTPRGFSGDGGPATDAHLYWPRGITVDNSDNLYIADSANNRVRMVTIGATITGVVANASGTPIAGAWVTAGQSGGPGSGSATTGADGTYVINSLPPGDYTVYAAAIGHESQYWDHAQNIGAATLVSVSSSGITQNINFNLPVMLPDHSWQAKGITGLPFTDHWSTASATLDAGEPQPCGNMGATIWYRLDNTMSPPGSIPMVIDTVGSDYSTAVAIYEVDPTVPSPPGGLTLVGCSANASRSWVTFTADPGQTYYVQIGGQSGATGSLVVNGDFDTDHDGLRDGVETNTGVFVGPANTGTNPAVVDTDGDSCGDGQEVLHWGLNPLNPWDFYTVPVPALFAAPNPLTDFRDNNVSAADAQSVFGYYKKGAKTGSLEYEQDLNGNGIKDGLEYDRSFAGPGMSGPPDGVVRAQDAQLAFAQYKFGYKC